MKSPWKEWVKVSKVGGNCLTLTAFGARVYEPVANCSVSPDATQKVIRVPDKRP